MASFTSGQVEVNAVFRLASRMDRMGLPCRLGISRFAAVIKHFPLAKFVRSKDNAMGNYGWKRSLLLFWMYTSDGKCPQSEQH